MEQSQGEIIQKAKRQELSSLFVTHRLNVTHPLLKIHEYIPYGLGVMARTRLTKSRGNNLKKTNMQEFFSLFRTHCLKAMHAPVKFNEYIPYGLRVMGRARLTIWN